LARNSTFRDITTAPRDGTLIEVRHGPDQVTVLARWAGQNQAFIRDDDPLRRTLHRVSLWRPAKPGERGRAAVTVADLVQPTERLIEHGASAATARPAAVVRPKKKSQPVPEKIIVTPRKKIRG
jgi:hypothetical protein